MIAKLNARPPVFEILEDNSRMMGIWYLLLVKVVDVVGQGTRDTESTRVCNNVVETTSLS